MSSFRWGIIACITQRNSQVTGKNKEGWYQTPGRHQNMIIKYLSVGLWSWFSYQQVALNVLFQMGYDSLPNSNKQPSDSLKAEATPVFTSNQDCFAYCFAQWCSPGVCRHASSFWSVTLQPLGADQSTIPHMKGAFHSFHMRYISMPCSKRLQRFWLWNSLSESSLVPSLHAPVISSCRMYSRNSVNVGGSTSLSSLFFLFSCDDPVRASLTLYTWYTVTVYENMTE